MPRLPSRAAAAGSLPTTGAPVPVPNSHEKMLIFPTFLKNVATFCKILEKNS
jgi:hypothetical protein